MSPSKCTFIDFGDNLDIEESINIYDCLRDDFYAKCNKYISDLKNRKKHIFRTTEQIFNKYKWLIFDKNHIFYKLNYSKKSNVDFVLEVFYYDHLILKEYIHFNDILEYGDFLINTLNLMENYKENLFLEMKIFIEKTINRNNINVVTDDIMSKNLKVKLNSGPTLVFSIPEADIVNIPRKNIVKEQILKYKQLLMLKDIALPDKYLLIEDGNYVSVSWNAIKIGYEFLKNNSVYDICSGLRETYGKDLVNAFLFNLNKRFNINLRFKIKDKSSGILFYNIEEGFVKENFDIFDEVLVDRFIIDIDRQLREMLDAFSLPSGVEIKRIGERTYIKLVGTKIVDGCEYVLYEKRIGARRKQLFAYKNGDLVKGTNEKKRIKKMFFAKKTEEAG